MITIQGILNKINSGTSLVATIDNGELKITNQDYDIYYNMMMNKSGMVICSEMGRYVDEVLITWDELAFIKENL